MKTICKILMALAFAGLLAEGDTFVSSLILKLVCLVVLVIAGCALDSTNAKEGRA